jgi:hypothetical protein
MRRYTAMQWAHTFGRTVAAATVNAVRNCCAMGSGAGASAGAVLCSLKGFTTSIGKCVMVLSESMPLSTDLNNRF